MPEPIAIIGLACQVPDGQNGPDLDLTGFENLLRTHGSSITEIPKSRFNAAAFHGSDSGTIVTTRGGFLTRSSELDYRAFGLSRAEFEAMSPSACRLVEIVHDALLQSGLQFRGTKTGVYVGASQPPALANAWDGALQCGPHQEAGISNGMLANRLSYIFDLRGPSLPVDTACSASLMALDLACAGLHRGDCDTAVVASANDLSDLEGWVGFSRLGVLSPTGTCSAFDEAADGYVRSEASAAVILKPLSRALADGDRVYSVILATATNANGHGMSLVSPSGEAQQACARVAFQRSGRDPASAIDLVEAHATGTQVGDATEVNALGELFFGDLQRSTPLRIGSVKSAVGHAELTAGLLSVIKATLSLVHNVVYPQVNFATPASSINWEKYKLEVPRSCEVLAPEGKRGLVAIASSGFGGANCYAILEAVEPVSIHGLVAVGGLAPQQVQNQLEQLKAGGPFDQAALLRSARNMPFRSVAFGDLTLPRTWTFSPPALVPQQSGLVMLFSGQGPQHAAMGRALFAHFAAFRESIKASDALFTRLTGRSLLAEGLFETSLRATPLPPIWPIALIQPALAMLQMAMHDLFASLNVKPTILLGHSAGETALLYAVGAFSRATAIAIANARGQALSLAEGTGTMAYAHAPLAVVRAEIATITASAGATGGVLELAAFNGPEAQLVSGTADEIARLVGRLKELKYASGLLRTSTPMHSSLLDVCKARFMQAVQAALPDTPCITQCDYVSTVTGAFVPAGQHITAAMIWANARQPVRFSQAMLSASALAAGPRGAKPPVVLEMTAHPVLASYVEELLPASAVIPTLRRCSQPWAEKKSFFDCLGRLLLSGACDTAHWHELAMRHVSAPALAAVKYPYQRAVKQTQYASVEARKKATRAPPLNDAELYLSQRGSDLADHIVEDSVIFPAAAFVEQALEYGVAEVHDLQVIAAIALPKSGSVRVSMARTANRFTIKTGGPEQERLHCQGVLVPGKPARLPLRDLPGILEQCTRLASQDQLPLVEKFGPRFRRIVWTKTNAEQTMFVSLVRGNQPDLSRLDEYCIHPALIDASWQTVAEGLAQHCTRLGDKLIGFYLPSSIARFRSFVDSGAMPPQFYSLGRISEVSRTKIKLDIEAVSESGEVLFVTSGLVCRRVSLLAEPKTHKALSIAWQPHSCPYPIELPADASFEPATVSVAERKLVYRTLDALAITTAKRTMAARPPYDAARLDRRRHYEWLVRTSLLPEPEIGKLSGDVQRRFAPLFEVMRRAMLHQASALLDDKKVISELFAEAHTMTDFYKMTTTLSPAYSACVRLFRDIVLKLAAHGKRVIRVAEIGAGTGQLTRQLAVVALELQETRPDILIEWTVTDVSLALVQQAAATLGARGVSPKLYDMNRDGPSQGLDACSFDIILASDALHACADIDATLAHVRELLVPAGCLLFTDADGQGWEAGPETGTPAHGTVFLDAVFGSFHGWYASEDERSHPLLSESSWRRHLLRQQFSDVHVLREPGAARILSHVMICAQASPEIYASQLAGADFDEVVWLSSQQEQLLSAAVAKQPERLLVCSVDDVGAVAARTISAETGLAVWARTFDAACSTELQRRDWPTLPGEQVIRVSEDGTLQVARLVPLLDTITSMPPAPPAHYAPPFWRLERTAGAPHVGLAQVHLPSPHGRAELELEVQHATQLLPGVCLSSCTSLGQTYTAVSTDIGNVIVAHRTMCMEVPRQPNDTPRFEDVCNGFLLSIALVQTARDVVSLPERVLLALPPRLTLRLGSFLARLGIHAVAIGPDTLDTIESVSTRTDWQTELSQLAAFDVAIASGEIAQTLAASRGLFAVEEVVNLDRLEVGSEEHTLADLVARSDRRVAAAMRLAYNIAQTRKPRSPRRTPSPPTPLAELLSKSAAKVGQTFSVSLRDAAPSPASIARASACKFNPRASYLLFGGCGGLGLLIANWLVQNGARHIVLTSRSGEAFFRRPSCYREAGILASLRQLRGVHIEVIKADGASQADTQAVFDKVIAAKLYPAGVFWLPVTLTDGSAESRTQADFDTTRASKTAGLEHILKCPLSAYCDFIIATSSLATVVGSPGQLTYAVANAQLEALARGYANVASLVVIPVLDIGIYRRTLDELQQGAVTTSGRRWGVTGDYFVGFVADCIERLRQGTAPAGAYVPHFDRADDYSYLDGSRLTAHLALRQAIDATSSDSSVDGITALVASMLDLKPAEVRPEVPLSSYGLDSLTAVRLSSALQRTANINMSQLQLLLGTNLQMLLDLAAGRTNTGSSGLTRPRAGSALLSHAHADSYEGIFFEDSAPDSIAVPLNTCTGHGVFLVPGAGGSLSLFLKLASDATFPLVALREPAGLDKAKTLEQMARTFADAVSVHQPSGVILLAGFSFGATVVVEMQRVLASRGRSCELMLLDHAPTALHAPSLLARISTEDGQPGSAAAAAAAKSLVFASMSTDVAVRGIGSPFAQVLDVLRLAMQGTHSARLAPWTTAWALDCSRHLRLLAGYAKERLHHGGAARQEHVSCPVTLVLASTGLVAQLDEQLDAQWISSLDIERLSPAANVVRVDGTHYSILDSAELAELLGAAVARQTAAPL